MYGLSTTPYPAPLPTTPDPRLRHVVFVDRPALRKRPLDLSPFRDGDAPQSFIGPSPAPQVLTDDADAFLRWLFRQAGLNLACYGPQTLARRFQACLRFLRATSPAHARQVLDAQPALVTAAIGMLLIGVTSFFRDPTVFDVLQRSVLPDLAQTRASLRVWSAGCSEGHELYSVAMLLAELDLLRRAELLGTDARPDAVRRAARGAYADPDLVDLPLARRQRFLLRDPAGAADPAAPWRVVEPLRKSAQWRRADATTTVEPGQWDLILCRNMAMYLRPPSALRLWQNLERSLRTGGYLVTGKAERPLGTTRLVPVAPCVYRREWA